MYAARSSAKGNHALACMAPGECSTSFRLSWPHCQDQERGDDARRTCTIPSLLVPAAGVERQSKQPAVAQELSHSWLLVEAPYGNV